MNPRNIGLLLEELLERKARVLTLPRRAEFVTAEETASLDAVFRKKRIHDIATKRLEERRSGKSKSRNRVGRSEEQHSR